MRVQESYWVDTVIDNGVAALFALACAFPALMLLADYGQVALALAGLTAVLAFAAARGLLRQMDRKRKGAGFAFGLAPLPGGPNLEMLELGEAERLAAEPAAELELDDVLEAVGPESRVVRLFAHEQAPTAGELLSRIDRHLAARREAPGGDDSDALFDALDELRRNLR